MKNVIFVLLIAAVGAGAYFYLTRKQHHTSDPVFSLVGEWKVDSIALPASTPSLSKTDHWVHDLLDSAVRKTVVEFRKDSLVIQTESGRNPDTGHYSLHGSQALLVWNDSDSDKTELTIFLADSTRIGLKDKDSTVFYFKRQK